MNQHLTEIFCFTIENHHFAIPLAAVDQIVMAMAVAPVPNSSPLLHGLIDYHGKVIPVINLRFRLQLPAQPIRISDVFIIADTSRRKIALVADEANYVIVPEQKDLVSATDLEPGVEAAGVLRRDDGIIFIYDIEKFISAEVEVIVQKAIESQMNNSE